MRWQKLISTILHPIVMPTIGVLLYFILTPYQIERQQQFTVLTIVFIATYIIPILLLVFLKGTGYIKSYDVFSISERKIPLFFMIGLLFFLGQLFRKIAIVRDLSYLFFGIVIGLIITYLLFFTKFKSSLHLLSMGGAIGYFLLFGLIHNVDTIPIVSIFVLLAGILGSSRLYLKAHTVKEVFTGFLIGFICQFVAFFYFLQ